PSFPGDRPRPVSGAAGGRKVSSWTAGLGRLLKQLLLKGLILAQNERWRRGLGMQVERIPVPSQDGAGGSGERGRKAWLTYPGDGHSPPNGGVIPGDLAAAHGAARKRVSPREGVTCY